MKRTLFIVSILIILSLVVIAHPGRTDKNGGHWDRQNGTYHFHSGEYAGRNSFSASSDHAYTTFEPPYEPPTDNPYKSKANTDNESSTIDTVLTILSCLFPLWCTALFVKEIFSNIDESCLMLIVGMFALFTLGYLLKNHPLLLLFIVVLLITIYRIKQHITKHR